MSGLMSMLMSASTSLPPIMCPVCVVERDRLVAAADAYEAGEAVDIWAATGNMKNADAPPFTDDEVAAAVAQMREVAAALPRTVVTMVGGTICCQVHAQLLVRWDILDWTAGRVIVDVFEAREPVPSDG